MVEISIEDPRWTAADFERLADGAVAMALGHFGYDEPGYMVSVLACDDARIATLNADFRGKPQPTNVLSWPSEERAAAEPGGTPLPPQETELGDIAIAYDTCAKEAASSGKPFSDHVTHLIVHGVLHLLGFDHENDADAALMEALEAEILAKLGLADPYS